MIELWQAEWCPHSHEVRQALTELGLPFLAHQVAAEPEQRDEMAEAVATREIPVVRLEDGTVLDGDSDEIVSALRARHPEPSGAEAHRRRALEEAGSG